MLRFKKKIRFGFLVFVTVVFAGFLVPQNLVMPVKGATKHDFNHQSFWYYPWGKSVTHKGVDIFASEGTEVVAATKGIVLFYGHIKTGGNSVLVLGPKWRLHYYAHLSEIDTRFAWINGGTPIARVGTSGNAKGKPPHLHYSIISLIPYPWRIYSSRQGYKKMFFLNPIDYLLNP